MPVDTFSGSIKSTLNFATAKTLDLGPLTYQVNFTDTITLSTGTGANQVNEYFVDDRSLNAGANEELDLAGVLLNPFGDTITFVGVKYLYIKNNSATETLTIGGAAAQAWEPWAGAAGDKIKIGPGGKFELSAPTAAGMAVGAGATDKLKIENSGGGITAYRIVIIGDNA